MSALGRRFSRIRACVMLTNPLTMFPCRRESITSLLGLPVSPLNAARRPSLQDFLRSRRPNSPHGLPENGNQEGREPLRCLNGSRLKREKTRALPVRQHQQGRRPDCRPHSMRNNNRIPGDLTPVPPQQQAAENAASPKRRRTRRHPSKGQADAVLRLLKLACNQFPSSDVESIRLLTALDALFPGEDPLVTLHLSFLERGFSAAALRLIKTQIPHWEVVFNHFATMDLPPAKRKTLAHLWERAMPEPLGLLGQDLIQPVAPRSATLMAEADVIFSPLSNRLTRAPERPSGVERYSRLTLVQRHAIIKECLRRIAMIASLPHDDEPFLGGVGNN